MGKRERGRGMRPQHIYLDREFYSTGQGRRHFSPQWSLSSSYGAPIVRSTEEEIILFKFNFGRKKMCCCKEAPVNIEK
jgi:hypothetical protein